VINIRGAHSYEHVHRLEGLGFLKKEPSGKSVTLTTTRMFAEYFGFDEDLSKLKLQLHRKLVKLSVKSEVEAPTELLESDEAETQTGKESDA
jgi:chromosome segregation and condensation protein ScpB